MTTTLPKSEFLSLKVTSLVFKRNVDQVFGEISLDSGMLRVLYSLDGKKDVATIAAELNMRVIEIKNVLRKLNKHKLILQVKRAAPVLGKDFFDSMESILTDAIGPFAKTLIIDTAKDMSESIDAFPKNLAAELVRKISTKIKVDKRQAFIRNMKPKLL